MTPTPARKFKARVLEARELTPEARHFILDIPELERFDFLPGQRVKATLAQGGQFEERAFALAAAPDGKRIELVMALTDDKIGRFLRTVGKSHRFPCFGPIGRLPMSTLERNALFVATGSGIAPMRAMIDQRLQPKSSAEGEPTSNDEPETTLLLGARTPDRLPFLSELSAWAERHPSFRFTPTISRGGREWEGKRGRVLMHLDEALAGDPARWDVYVAGRPQMVRDATEALVEAGVPADSIRAL